MKSLLPILLMVFIYLPGFLGSIYICPSTSHNMLTDTSEIKLLNDYSSQEGILTHTLERVIKWGGNFEDIAYDLAIDASDNVYLAGETYNTNTNYTDAFVAKYGPTGNLIWNVTWGLQGYNDTASAISVDANYNVYITGYTYNDITFFYTRMFCVKFNSFGALEWNISGEIYDTDTPITYGFDLTLDGSNIYVVGATADNYVDSLIGEVFIIWKYDTNGTQLNYIQDEEFSDGMILYGVTTDSRHEVYYAGSYAGFGDWNWEQQAVAWKSNDQLEKSTLNYFYEDDFDRIGEFVTYPICCKHPAGGHAVVVDRFDNIYLIGSVFMNYPVDNPRYYHVDSFIKRYSSQEVMGLYEVQSIWYRSWGHGHTGYIDDFYFDDCNDEIAMDIACSGDNLYVVGTSYQHRSNESDLCWTDLRQKPRPLPGNIFLLNYKTAGSFTWSLSWGSANGNDQAYGVAVDSKENLYVAGYTNSSGAGMGDALLLKYCLISADTIPGFEALVTLLGVIALVYIFFRRPLRNNIT